MAITLQQTGRTTTSVTFSISGITGDRQTYIWLPMLGGSNKWTTLSAAYSLGYVSSYSATDSYNGNITVNFYSRDTEIYKVWEFYVYNYANGNPTESSNILDTVLAFQYDNALTKSTGGNIDITVNDMRRINLFASYMDSWINNGTGTYYPLTSNVKGDSIFAVYLTQPARNIYNTAYNLGSTRLPNRSSILNYTGNILDYVSSGATFRASYFNNIRDAINNFNMRA